MREIPTALAGKKVRALVVSALMVSMVAGAFFVPGVAAAGPCTVPSGDHCQAIDDLTPVTGLIILDPWMILLMELHKLFPWLW